MVLDKAKYLLFTQQMTQRRKQGVDGKNLDLD
jgi:hypothetical protein